MQVSAKTDYALRAAAELARAAAEERGPIKGEWISEAQGISKKFMENILHDLKRAGVVRTRRGASGGYWLARPAAEITLAEVIRAVEGPLANVRGEWLEEGRVRRRRRSPAGSLDRRPRRPRVRHPRRPRRRDPAQAHHRSHPRPRSLGASLMELETEMLTRRATTAP